MWVRPLTLYRARRYTPTTRVSPSRPSAGHFTDLKKRRVSALINSDAIAIFDTTQLAALGKFKIGADRDGSLGGIAV